MKKLSLTSSAAAVALLAALVNPAQAQVIISEVAPFGSGTTAYAADWFELTNTGSSAVNISGWKMDDNSNASSSAVAIFGVTSIAAGQSVVFLEAAPATASTTNANFISFWFGASAPSGLVIGNYSGSGVGLGTSGDAVNIFNNTGSLVTRVDFAGNTGPSTFDNSAGLSGGTISTLSVNGSNGAFTSFNSVGSVGSPGYIAAVPEAGGYAMALAGLGALGLIARRRKA
jgi:MYXO-CTERM domain-containing protein